MAEYDLEAIINYNMTPLEAKAYKIGLMWERLCKKLLPNEKTTKYPTKKDPRKSYLFKCSYKLATETKGIIDDKDYLLYIISQIEILKSINDGKQHALIDPSCLNSKKAWHRWKLWKYKYDKKSQGTNMKIPICYDKIKKELLETKKFLEKNLKDNFQPSDIQTSIQNGKLLRWLNLKQISPYFVILSNYIDKNNLQTTCDFALFPTDKIIENLFKEIFVSNSVN